ncbi:protein PLANT CADMIUM RESISTANCE 2-like [Bidens hawaiensis]|uniref:protein PLANT CADMIUM RESISTANCE 2-like n=1 Tax=Bidens hawaiensis TaxID=980011 RepID=UPI0040497579
MYTDPSDHSKPAVGQPMQPPQAPYGQASHVITPPLDVMYPSKWSSGLCDCTSDMSNCCMTCWCPCITFGQIAEIVDKGTTSCPVYGTIYSILLLLVGFQWVFSCLYRSRMRQQYMLPKEPCNDCLIHYCCEQCALCQEYRELKHRGYNMLIGWHGNMEKQPQQAVMTPPYAQEGMKR